MSHCVPDWDGNGGELDSIIPSDDYLPPVEGKWESLPQKRSHLSDLAFVRSRNVVEPHWTENGYVAMQGPASKGNKPQWQVNDAHNWSAVPESDDGVTPSKPRDSSPAKDGSLVANEPVVVDTPVHTSYLHDDEMVSWLQYPLDDSLERNYCSEFFGELPSSTISNTQLIKESFAAGQTAAGRCGRNLGPSVAGNNASSNRAASADAAMALGAGRAAGLLPQAGVEAFTKVRTTMQQPNAGKWGGPAVNQNAGKTLGAFSTSVSPAARTSQVAPNLSSSPMLLPKSQCIAFQPPRTGPMNFSHFSRPAVLMKANLQCLGMTAGAGTTRLKAPFSGNPSTSSGSSIAESTITRQLSGAPSNKTDVRVEGPEGQQQSLGAESSWPSMQTSPLAKEGEDAEAAVNSDIDRTVSLEGDNPQNAGGPSSVLLSNEKHLSRVADLQEVAEPTITSSSGGSGNSVDRGKEAASSGKRRTREGEDSECQSEGGEYETPESKKPQQRGSTAKRSRAAEVHNLSERRRRDRINEKMKALQELIPNSNKTDKASMLDEAIEYLKMLQLQLQMMSMRSGMSIPSMVMPAGMQHLQMGPMPPMGMGMAPMMGMGMGMMDMGVGRPPHMMPLPSHGALSHTVSATSPAVTMVDSHDHRLQSNSVMESLNVYLARQQQLQMPPQPMNMDVYNIYMMHQQHQQQQHQYQQHHQFQQHHQVHHLPSNMGGGAPQ